MMSDRQAAPRTPRDPTEAPGAFRRATVISQAGALFVELEGGTRPALRAVSCLIEPAPGDTVLVWIEGTAHILAILARPGIADAVLSLPDRAATLRLRAQSVGIEADTSVRVSAPEVTLKGTDLHFFGNTIAWLGRTIAMLGERLTASVTQTETIAARVVTRAASRVTVIDGVDTEQLGSRIATVRGLASESTGSTIITGTEDVRVDAKRISLG